MATSSNRVFVLGAGFTKAFIPQSPLLIDDFGLEDLWRSLPEHSFSHARRILRAELDACGNGKANLERLMTRLSGGMPYDRKHRAEPELRWLIQRVTQLFLQKLEQTYNPQPESWKTLAAFASDCLARGHICITFNYDLLMEEWLAKVSRSGWGSGSWNPYSGYGFFCKGSHEWIGINYWDDQPPTMTLIKLHGSLNWRVRLLQQEPYMPGDIVHHSPSVHRIQRAYQKQGDVDQSGFLLEENPFIVPPVLTKAELAGQPILALLWANAYKALCSASEVIFIGYSMPMTDVGGGFLFRESLGHLDQATQIKVVSFAQPGDEGEQKANLCRSYKSVFPKFEDARIDLGGAVRWLEINIPPLPS
jgi:hypothetical protein